MTRRFALIALGLVVASVLGWATTCPEGKYPVTFRYIPLPGEKVVSVSLRGSFNNWGEWPMEKQPDGTWAITVCLAPGEYQYKFYINGRWPRDMATDRAGGPVDLEAHGYVDDGFGGRNAVRRVGLYFAGTWDFKIRVIPSPLIDRNNLTLTMPIYGYSLTSLTKMGSGGVFEEQGFELSGLLLGATEVKGGMYFDPQAVKYKHTFLELKPPISGMDFTAKVEHWAEGYLPASRCPVEVTFTFDPRGADWITSVTVAGEFNGWNPTATPMTYDPVTGLWSVTVRLDPGTVRYKYVINGSWVGNMSTDHPVGGGPVDPAADGYVDDGFGGQNAVRIVRSVCKADLVPVTFRYIPRAGQTIRRISVPGAWPAWTGYGWWDPSNAPELSPQPDGTWSVTLMLPPGTFIEYKYYIEDNWGTGWVPWMPNFAGSPADPDAQGYRWGGNAVRFVGDPMPAYMRYTLSAKLGNIEGTLRFEDCCCGIMFKDLTITLKDVSLCCGITFTSTFYFTKAGFQHLTLSMDNLFSPCCGINFGVDIEFGTAYKKVSPRFSWPGISGCFTVYGDVRTSGFSIQGIEIYGWKIRCDLAPCGYIEILTALNVVKIEEIFKADIFFDDEYEMVKIGFCGQGCCGGNWNLAVTTFFSPTGGLFDIKRMWIDADFPLTKDLKVVLNLSPTLGQLYAGFVLNF